MFCKTPTASQSDFLTTPPAKRITPHWTSWRLPAPQAKRTTRDLTSWQHLRQRELPFIQIQQPKCSLDLRFSRVKPPEQDTCPPQPNIAQAAATKEQERVSKTIKRQVFLKNNHHFSIRRAARRECAVTTCVCVLPCLLHTMCKQSYDSAKQSVMKKWGAERKRKPQRTFKKHFIWILNLFSAAGF